MLPKSPSKGRAVDRGMCIDGLRLLEKKGGKSGHWTATDPAG